MDIIEGVLPPGERLRSADLTARYQVSATPLREALQRLAAQSLVDIDPRFGATVARVSRNDLRDTYELREVLETLALERSIARGDDAWIQAVAAAFIPLTDPHIRAGLHESFESALNWSRLHRAFHEALFAASDSKWLGRMLATLYDHSERYRLLIRRTGNRDTLEEHTAIYDAAVARDAEAAKSALTTHLRRTVELLESAIPLSVSDDGHGSTASQQTAARESTSA